MTTYIGLCYVALSLVLRCNRVQLDQEYQDKGLADVTGRCIGRRGCLNL